MLRIQASRQAHHDFGSFAYCAGCNGSFILDFGHTSIGTSKGVYGVGFDFVNDGPPLFSPQYTAFITFGDKSSVNELLPIEFQPQTGFFGVTSEFSDLLDCVGIA